MSWKDLPYWLKGAIYALIFCMIYGFIFFIALGSASDPSESSGSSATFGIISLLLVYPLILAGNFLGVNSLHTAFVFFSIIITTLGLIIGGIYGSFKPKKTNHFHIKINYNKIISVIVIVVFIGIIILSLQPKLSVRRDRATSKAIEKENVLVCNNLPKTVFASVANPRADCYYDYAVETQDASVCLKMRDLMLSSHANDAYKCYAKIAALTGNSKMCDEFDKLFGKHDVAKRYKITCYNRVAVKLQDISLCDNLKGETRLYCMLPFSNSSICEQFSERGKIHCQKWVGVNILESQYS